jgi:hypothetical protein
MSCGPRPPTPWSRVRIALRHLLLLRIQLRRIRRLIGQVFLNDCGHQGAKAVTLLKPLAETRTLCPELTSHPWG